MSIVSEFRVKLLSRERNAGDYEIYRAGLEWDLTDPIVIDSPDDIKSSQKWKEHLKPYHHQVQNLITFCRRLPVTLIADDVGLGKTISAGLILSELVARSRISRVLVVAPKLLGQQWKDELKTKFDIPAEVVIGKDLIKADLPDGGAIITTYNSARIYLSRIPSDRFEMLILDEAHKLRNLHGTEKAPQVATCFRDALDQRRFQFVLMLTATPIQNRLWDLYSLVDLLTASRGHENPFGSPGMFTRKFVADPPEARNLKPESKNEFRSIVYGYMSRIRRGDAKLYFPDRVVELHRETPTSAELELIKVISKPIQQLPRLVQISILQALTSSPDALNAQLKNMARNGTVGIDLSHSVDEIVKTMPPSAKLRGLAALIGELRSKNKETWRVVIFTGRRETQTTIQNYLKTQGIPVGIINGSTSGKNQDTIARFREKPPKIRVIVSTEAGSEGVNLQVANVLVNFDLPWNPMIVEQRIGRVQRLASEHAHVSIFNIILKGTFEEYIVGRLMEKLQMASHAIGDIESLLEAANLGDADGDGTTGLEEKILSLVLAALSGKDVEAEAQLAEKSIAEARATLEREEEQISELLGGMEEAGYVGPRTPKLPPMERSLGVQDFTLAALRSLGATVTTKDHGGAEVRRGASVAQIRFRANGENPRTVDESQTTFSFSVSADDVDTLAAVCTGSDWTPVSVAYTVLAIDSNKRNVHVCAYDSGKALVTGKGAGKFMRDVLLPAGLAKDIPRSLASQNGVEYAESSPAFRKLVDEIVASGIYRIDDDDREASTKVTEVAKKWASSFEGRVDQIQIRAVSKSFSGAVLVKIRATVAHDSYERLVEIPCSNTYHSSTEPGTKNISPLASTLRTFEEIGLDSAKLRQDAEHDVGVAEFTRFYLERREQEMRNARADERKRKKLEDDFTPRLSLTLVGASGRVRREVTVEVHYSLASGGRFQDVLRIVPSTEEVAERPPLRRCEESGRTVPASCLAKCEISNTWVLSNLLVQSGFSSRRALVRHTVICSSTGKTLLSDEAATSAISGQLVTKSLLKRCAITQQLAEPEHLGRCEFNNLEVLQTLLAKSEFSGRSFIAAEAERSTVSGKIGHRSELIACYSTHQPIGRKEAEACSATGHLVSPKVLIACDVTSRRVLSSELERCTVTSKRALKGLFVRSSITNLPLLEEVAVRSASGMYCAPAEVRRCSWSDSSSHPDDIKTCSLVGLSVHSTYLTSQDKPRLRPLVELLDISSAHADDSQLWPKIGDAVGSLCANGKAKVEAAIRSPSGKILAVCCRSSSWMGLSTNYVGAVYDVDKSSIAGRIAKGKRRDTTWIPVV